MGLFGERNKKGLELLSITDLNVGLRNKIFYKRIQDKLGCSDSLMNRIEKAIPAHTRCKNETWEQPEGRYYERHKTWITIDGKIEYDEIEESFRDEMLHPLYIWEVMLCQLLSEEETEAEEQKGDSDISSMKINFVFCDTMRAFLLYISGGRFTKKEEKESLADMRPFEEKLVEGSILFKLPIYDFKYLEPYHFDVNNSFVTPDEAYYYVPLDDYRKYGNWLLCSKEKRDESKQTGIIWTTEYYDFIEDFLPKLEREKNKK
jgi:hypothetical protein